MCDSGRRKVVAEALSAIAFEWKLSVVRIKMKLLFAMRTILRDNVHSHTIAKAPQVVVKKKRQRTSDATIWKERKINPGPGFLPKITAVAAAVTNNNDNEQGKRASLAS